MDLLWIIVSWLCKRCFLRIILKEKMEEVAWRERSMCDRYQSPLMLLAGFKSVSPSSVLIIDNS